MTILLGAVLMFSTPVQDDKVEKIRQLFETVKALLDNSCTAKARAALAQAEKELATLDEFERDKVAREFDVDYLRDRSKPPEMLQHQMVNAIDRKLNAVDSVVENTASDPSEHRESFDDTLKRVGEMLTDDDVKKLLGDELQAKYQRKLEWLKKEFARLVTASSFRRVEELLKKIQEALNDKEGGASEDSVERWIKSASDALALCPKDDPRTKKLREQYTQQRTAFMGERLKAARDEVVGAAVQYWKMCKEEYGAEAKGWEAESKPSGLSDYLHNAPPSLGCDKTEKFLREVVQRWFEDERTAKAIEDFNEDAEFKAAFVEATKLREAAGGKLCSFAGSLLDVAEKLSAGQERDDMGALLEGMHGVVEQAKGATACEKTLARIDGLKKRWEEERSRGAAAKEALTEKLTSAANAVWPDYVAVYASKVKEVDAPAALKNIQDWSGTVVRFTGGAKSVNLNRAGWNFEDQYDFIVEVDGVPVCGNFDGGLAAALKNIRAQTGMEPDNCEECVGIIDGVCKVYERKKHLYEERYVRGEQIDGVRMRIVAWKACTAAACVNKGTNLSKCPEFKPVDVPEKGSSGK